METMKYSVVEIFYYWTLKEIVPCPYGGFNRHILHFGSYLYKYLRFLTAIHLMSTVY